MEPSWGILLGSLVQHDYLHEFFPLLCLLKQQRCLLPHILNCYPFPECRRHLGTQGRNSSREMQRRLEGGKIRRAGVISGNLWLNFGYTLLLGVLGCHNTPGTLLRSTHIFPEVKKAKLVRGFSIIKTLDKENNSTPAGRHLSTVP